MAFNRAHLFSGAEGDGSERRDEEVLLRGEEADAFCVVRRGAGVQVEGAVDLRHGIEEVLRGGVQVRGTGEVDGEVVHTASYVPLMFNAGQLRQPHRRQH